MDWIQKYISGTWDDRKKEKYRVIRASGRSPWPCFTRLPCVAGAWQAFERRRERGFLRVNFIGNLDWGKGIQFEKAGSSSYSSSSYRWNNTDFSRFCISRDSAFCGSQASWLLALARIPSYLQGGVKMLAGEASKQFRLQSNLRSGVIFYFYIFFGFFGSRGKKIRDIKGWKGEGMISD